MTEKQRNCIEWICNTLQIKYCGKDTKKDAAKFIGKFIDRARAIQQESNFYNAWGMSYFLNRPLR